MGILSKAFKFATAASNLRVFEGKSGTYLKSSGSGRKGRTAMFEPKSKK